ncbi:granulocyte colony-stimulating factor receptor [Eucyclogobius newberryi]|uniref:granulocyte colony-stimulating factor receptor n=1 Tax=Eucyclogobius newberryi TaxID=166745 RepID=UPI003B59FE20
MISTRLSLIVVLLASVNGERNEDAVQPCAEVKTSSSVVVVGSSVSASCTVREDCPIPIPPSVPLEWQLDGKGLPSSSVANQSGSTSTVVIPNFNSTTAVLTCTVQTSPPQIVGGVQIRTGYLPSVPQNLHCQTNLTTPSTMLCSWDPGRDSLLLTGYSLHTYIRDSKKNHSYSVPPGRRHHTIPRSDFTWYSNMEIYVRAQNELGESASAAVVVEPLSAAKFDPPEILSLHAPPKQYGCLKIRWQLSQHEAWVQDVINVEVRLTALNSVQLVSIQEVRSFEKRARPSRPICRLLHGTRYVGQMRVRYRQSPWSEWSGTRSGVTLESAPTGRLDSWMKVSGDHTHKQVSVHLFWKPSKQFRANGQNVSYVVSRVKEPGERARLCATAERHCTFRAPARASRVYLSSVNAAGRSRPIEIRIYRNKDYRAVTDMTVTPYDDTSLVVTWTSLHTPSLLGFMVEWRPLLKTDPAHLQFQSTNQTQSSLIIAGSIEPYKPYGISVYPRFKDGIGLPQTANAFSRQKAPSTVPKLRTEKTWQFDVELIWDDIPLDEMNGEIQGYKVFYSEENGPVRVVQAKPDKRRVLLKDLNPMSVYEAVLEASTFGGSRNGSKIHFKTESFDIVFVVTIVSFIMVMISTSIIIFVYYSSRGRFKNHFCPIIPDPANSSIKDLSTESLEDIHFFNSKEPSLSQLSFLALPTKSQKEEDDDWLNSAEDTSDLGESICGSPFIPGYCGSNSDSVPYATVIFSSPSTSPDPRENHTYLRSESTQPLLEAEEAFTPKCYQNITADKIKEEPCFFGPSDCDETEHETDIGWEDFPFLRALALNDIENE